MKILVGDSTYGARVMRERLWKERKLIIIAPPHYIQKKQMTIQWQSILLSMCLKIESAFDILKVAYADSIKLPTLTSLDTLFIT